MDNNRFRSQMTKGQKSSEGEVQMTKGHKSSEGEVQMTKGHKSSEGWASMSQADKGARTQAEGRGFKADARGARDHGDGRGFRADGRGAREQADGRGFRGAGRGAREHGQPPKAPKVPKMQTTTLWDFPSQHYGEEMQGDADYIGATPSYVIWNLLHRYTKPGAVVIDPFCGSGTTLDVCKDLDRRGIGFDIAPSRPDIQKADARHIPLDDASADFVFIDPPYSTHVKYSGDQQCIGELDARGGGYYEAMEEVIADIYRVLKPGAYFALYVSDSQAKNKAFCPIGFELFLRMTRLFEPVDVVCVTRHNKSLKRNHWHTSAIEGNYFLRGFNYLFIVRKRPVESADTHKHEEAGMLSKLFEAAAKASPGEVVTPEKFGHLLDNEKDKLQEHLSKKQQKKLNRAARAPQKTEADAPRQGPVGAIKPRQQPAGKKFRGAPRKGPR